MQGQEQAVQSVDDNGRVAEQGKKVGHFKFIQPIKKVCRQGNVDTVITVAVQGFNKVDGCGKRIVISRIRAQEVQRNRIVNRADKQRQGNGTGTGNKDGVCLASTIFLQIIDDNEINKIAQIGGQGTVTVGNKVKPVPGSSVRTQSVIYKIGQTDFNACAEFGRTVDDKDGERPDLSRKIEIIAAGTGIGGEFGAIITGLEEKCFIITKKIEAHPQCQIDVCRYIQIARGGDTDKAVQEIKGAPLESLSQIKGEGTVQFRADTQIEIKIEYSGVELITSIVWDKLKDIRITIGDIENVPQQDFQFLNGAGRVGNQALDAFGPIAGNVDNFAETAVHQRQLGVQDLSDSAAAIRTG